MIMRSAILASLAAATVTISCGLAGAQTSGGHAYPSIGGEKVRGLEELNNSGQVGTVALTSQPDKTTHVILTVKGFPTGKSESAAIYRSADSTCSNLAATPDVQLAPVVAGSSSSFVKIDRDRLLSGHYFVVVSDGSTHVSCGHLQNE